MSFRLIKSSRALFQPTRFNQYNKIRHFACSSSSLENNKEPQDAQKQNDTETTNTLATTEKAVDSYLKYLESSIKPRIERLQSDVKPHLDICIRKMNDASRQIKQLTNVGDSKEALQKVSKALNELTGYDQIDAVKQKVNSQAHIFESTRDEVQSAKRAYEAAIATRSSTQRGINELLQRKHLWTSDDVTQFTELYRLEHSHSQQEATSKEKYQACEKKMDREYLELARSIMERYHDEQLWSDKIRSVSTYGTWALMVVNLMLFVAVQTIFEPNKRKRLTDRFEELLVTKMAEEEEKFGVVFKTLDEKDNVILKQQVAVMETLNALTEHPLFDDEILKSLELSTHRRGSLHALSAVAGEEEDTLEKTVSQSGLNDEELSGILLLTPVDDDDTPFYETEEQGIKAAPTKLTQPNRIILPTHQNNNTNTVTISKSNLVLYSIESAVVGGLVTAITVYFFS